MFIVIIIFILIAVALAWFLVANDRGEREPIAALWLAAGFGVAAAFSAGMIEAAVIPQSHFQTGAETGHLLSASLLIGIIEEACKFVPFAIFIYKRRYFNEHTDGIIYFALAGLGFGLPENILYTVQHGSETGMTRLVLTPLLHAGITGMIGYFFARRKLAGKGPFGIAGVLAIAMLVHGMYDFGLLSGNSIFVVISLLITTGLSIALFTLFMRATELDQARGLSAAGNNKFCRHCGWPNPNGNLYCVRCGKNA